MSKKIWRTLIWTAVAFLLTALSVRAAYNERGYLAYGGEWLVFPLIMLTRYAIYEIGEEFKEAMSNDD